MFHYAMQSGLVLAQDAESADGGNLLSLLAPLIIIGGLFYFILIRPQRKRMRQLEDIRKAIDIGDEVRTVGGIFGVVTDLSGDVVVIDPGGGTTLRMARGAIAERVEADEPEAEDA